MLDWGPAVSIHLSAWIAKSWKFKNASDIVTSLKQKAQPMCYNAILSWYNSQLLSSILAYVEIGVLFLNVDLDPKKCVSASGFCVSRSASSHACHTAICFGNWGNILILTYQLKEKVRHPAQTLEPALSIPACLLLNSSSEWKLWMWKNCQQCISIHTSDSKPSWT